LVAGTGSAISGTIPKVWMDESLAIKARDIGGGSVEFPKVIACKPAHCPIRGEHCRTEFTVCRKRRAAGLATSTPAPGNGEVCFCATPLAVVVKPVILQICGDESARIEEERKRCDRQSTCNMIGRLPMPECLTALTSPRSGTEEKSIVNATLAFAVVPPADKPLTLIWFCPGQPVTPRCQPVPNNGLCSHVIAVQSGACLCKAFTCSHCAKNIGNLVKQVLP
jgi:hypothetical protein